MSRKGGGHRAGSSPARFLGGRLARNRLAALGVLLAVSLSGACDEEATIDPPRPLFGEVPVRYPVDLWDEDIEGETLVRVLVNQLGRVDSVEVLESSGFPAFDSAATRGARDLRFDPARRDGERVTVWAQVPVRFSKRPRSELPP